MRLGALRQAGITERSRAVVATATVPEQRSEVTRSKADYHTLRAEPQNAAEDAERHQAVSPNMMMGATLHKSMFGLIAGSTLCVRRGCTTKKGQPFLVDLKEAATYSPTFYRSTIGAIGLNFSVRNGKR